MRRPSGKWSALLVILLLALLPVLVLALRAPFQEWVPVGDTAVIGLRVAAVGTRHTPLVGPYSHFGWSHPGPLLFYVLALPYRLLGGSSDGLLLGALAVNALAVFVLARTLLRRGGVALAAAGLACFAWTLWTLGASWLWYPWNPNVVLLPFAGFIVVTWSVALGRRWDLPWLVLFGSFLVQTHVAYGVLVAALSALALGYLWRARRAETADKRDRRPLLLSAALLVVLWIPPAVDALWHDGGNLRALADFWLGGSDTIGISRALKLMSFALSARAPWLGFHDPTSAFDGVVPHGVPIPLGLVALAVGGAFAFRRRDRVAGTLCVVVAVAIVAGVASLARIVGPSYDYLVYWTRIIAATTWLAAGWAIVRALPGPTGVRVRQLGHVAVIAVAVGTVALWTWSAVGTGIGPKPEQGWSRELARVLPSVRRAVGAREAVHVAANPSFFGGTYAAGLLFALVQDGIAVSIPRGADIRLGGDYSSPVGSDLTLAVASGSQEIAKRAAAGDHLVAQSGPVVAVPAGLPPQEPGEALLTYLQRIRDVVDPVRFRQLQRAWSPSAPVAVFSTTADTR